MSRLRRGLRRAALGLVGSLTLLVAALAALLARGPIGLDVLRPYLERALSPPNGSFRVHVPSSELAWDTGESQLELRATSVRVVGRGGAELAEIPAVAVRLARGALLRGRIAPAEIRLLEPRLTVVRDADGGLDLNVAAGRPATDEPVDLRAVVDGLARGAGSLRRLSVRRADIALVDQRSARTWRLANADLVLAPGGGGLTGSLTGRLEVAPNSVFLRAAAGYRPGRDHGTVILGFRRLQPEMLGDLPIWSDDSAARRAVTALRMPLDGTLAVTLDSGLRPIAARGHVRGGAGRIDAGPTLDPVEVTGLYLRGRVDAARHHLEVQRLSLGLDVARAHASGDVSWTDDGVAVDARVTAERLPLDTLGRWWPESAAPGARRWVVERRSGGEFTTAELEVHAAIEAASHKVAVQLRRGTARFDGVTLRYHDQMPALAGLVGTVRLDDRGWKLHGERGRIGTIELVGASAAFPLGQRRESRARVTAALRGAVPEALAILDREPFAYARALGVTPAAVAGAMTAHLAIDAPMAGAGAVAMSGTAHLTDVAMDGIISGLPLGDGAFALDFAPGRVRVRGTARVAGGTPVTIDWSQDSSVPGGPAREATVSGRLDSEDRRRLGLDLVPWLDGPVDAEVRLATSRGNGALDVHVRLDDARIETGIGRLGKATGAPGHADARFTLAGNVVTGAERLRLEAGPTTVTGTATRTTEGWDRARLDTSIAAASAGTEPGRCTLTLERQQGGHRFRLTSDDAGALLRSLTGDGGLRDGRLVLTGTAEAGDGIDATARLDVDDAVLVGSRILTRIAALGSLSTIERALAGGGLPFDRLGAALRYRDPILSITDGIAHGSALTVAVDGTIDRHAATADLRGTVIPSYYGLNRTPGRIPIVKHLMGSGDAKGVQAIDFTADGPVADPRVRVRPMSAIAPGVLRDVLRKIRR